MNNILIDSDVILDFFFDRKPHSEYASIIFTLCEQKKIQGFITPVIISNVYYLLRKTATHKKVLEKLNILLSITDVLAMDKEVVQQAMNSEFKDFEDALQNFSALKNGTINSIVTRNVKDYKKSEIGVLTPESFIQSFDFST
jgi:predicted nucleic acid-binding protein